MWCILCLDKGSKSNHSQLQLYFKVTGYPSLIKYPTNKTAYTRSSLPSIAEPFAVWLKHTVDYLENENQDYEQDLVQGIQCQTWSSKNQKSHLREVVGY